jgi:hypothetical protein
MRSCRGTTNHAKRTNKTAEQNTFVALDGTEQPERGEYVPSAHEDAPPIPSLRLSGFV